MTLLQQNQPERDALAPLRQRVAPRLVGFRWLHLPSVLLTVWWLEPSSSTVIILGTFAICAVVTLLWKTDRGGPAFRYAIAAGSMGMVSLILASFANHPWQIDIHMYFFASLAIASAMSADFRAAMRDESTRLI